MQGYLSGKEAALPPFPPLRTGRESFPSSSSSLHKAPFHRSRQFHCLRNTHPQPEVGLIDLLSMVEHKIFKLLRQPFQWRIKLFLCKYCNSSEVVRYGTQSGRSRFRCKECGRIFKTDCVYRAYEAGRQRRDCGHCHERRRHPGYSRAFWGIGKRHCHFHAQKKSFR